MCLARAEPRSAAAHPAARRAVRRRPGAASCTSSTAARTPRPTPISRSARSCARGSTGVRAELPAPPILDRDPARLDAAEARALRRRRAAGVAGGLAARRSRATNRARLDGAAALRRLRRRQARGAAGRRRAGPRRGAADAMPPSTDAASLLPRLLARHRARARRAPSSCASACTRDPSSRTPRSTRRPPSRAASCRSPARPVAGTGPDRARGRRRRGRRSRCAPSSTGCPCASARERALQRAAARRCTPAATTCTWPRWSRSRAPRTRSRDELPAPLLAVFQPSEEAYPSGAEQLAAAASSRRSRRAARRRGARASGAAVGHRRARRRRRQRVLRRRRDHRRGRALARRLPASRARPDPRDRRRSSSRCTPRSARRIDPLGAGVAHGRRARGRQRRERDPRARAARGPRCARSAPRTALALRELVEEVVAGVAAAHGCRGDASSSCPASRRSRTIPRSSRARASCSPRAGLAAGAAVALVRL